MDLYDGRYFSINKFLSQCLGIWPFDSKRKYFISCVALVSLLLFMAPHVIGIVVNRSNIDRLMEHICITIFLAAIFLKLLAAVAAEKKMKIMLDDIIDNWKSIDDEEEIRTLQKYSERGRVLSIAHLAYIGAVGICFVFLPMIPIIVNGLSLSSEPLPRLFLINGEFLVDRNDHYWKIYFWDVSTTLIPATIIVGVDAMYMACVEHCVGLFAIVRQRLHAVSCLTEGKSITNKDAADVSYNQLIHIVQLHHRVLRFADTLEAAYSLCFLCIMTINLVLIPLICTMIIMNLGETTQWLRYFLIFTGLAVHLLCISVGGQKVIDASSDLLWDAYDNEWYETSNKTKKALEFVMLRCTQPSMLTAGGLMIMGMETYLKIMKTSLSYITVLSSFR